MSETERPQTFDPTELGERIAALRERFHEFRGRL
jgi:hypothetical protein